MATLETVLRVFVASPEDVTDARNRLGRVVEELNYTWSRTFRVRLELLRWETHAYPDIGEDAQDVINRQLGEFDIFLGIMWMRFGQPTGRAGSGTEEEFDRARRRYEADRNAVRMMFYFKDASPPKLSQVDSKQLQAVRRFRRKVEKSGMLYRPYRTLQEFEGLVRQHLSRQVQEWGKKWGGTIADVHRPSATSQETQESQQTPVIGPEEGVARSITAIVFEEMADRKSLVQRRDHDPEVIHRSFLEAQLALDSAPGEDAWGRLAAQQATALVAIALGGRLAPNEAARDYVTRVSERIIGLRGLRIVWGARGQQVLYELLARASDRHDDDVLLWLKRHTRKRS
jgi:hypothetical protein